MEAYRNTSLLDYLELDSKKFRTMTAEVLLINSFL